MSIEQTPKGDAFLRDLPVWSLLPVDPGKIADRLAAIPADSVTARTAGALRVDAPCRSPEEERAAFEHAVADENALREEE